MTVRVRVHGYLEDEFKQSAFHITDIEEGLKLGELLKLAWSEYGRSPISDQCIVTVNYRIAQPDQVLNEGDQVDILPPAVGG